MGTADAECPLDGGRERRCIEGGEIGDQDDVDEILGPATGAPALVDAGVGVQLLGDLGLQRN